MKIRSGFVSNSSSASFIVAVKSTNKCPTCGRGDPNFLNLVPQKGGYEDTKLKYRGVAAIEEYWKEEIFPYSGDGEKHSFVELVSLMKEAEQKGYEVGEVEISYHDTATDNLMHELVRTGAAVILWSDHYGIDRAKIKL